MIKKMLINATDPEELRVALLEEGRLEGFFVETASREATRGNIYKGVVANVEPSLQAAFIDYGVPRHGFLQIGDVHPDLIGERKGKGPLLIQDVLKRGQTLLVQVVKVETGNKGASLTTNLSLPGQVLVLTVGRDSKGVSRKLEDEGERGRLKKALSGLKIEPGFGIIARTAAEGRPKKDIQAEVRMLVRLWRDIEKRAQKAKAPALIHKEQELAVRAVRDLFTSDVKEILVDNPEVFTKVERFVSLANPRRKSAVKLHHGPRPVFARHEIEDQLKGIFQPEVRLPSGAGIVIQSTEALVSVDVNSGKAIKGKQIEDTALNVNLEAAGEIARQLRLRDLGGLIVIDFIDMRERKNQRLVLQRLKEELKKDKAKTTVGSFSRFGLIELSRQRIRPPADFGSTQTCPHCGGRGMLRTPEAVGRSVLRRVQLKLGQSGGPQAIRVSVHPDIAAYLANARRAELAKLEQDHGVCIELAADAALGVEDISIERGDRLWSLPQAAPPQPVEPEAPSPAPPPPQPGGQPAAKAESQPAAKAEGQPAAKAEGQPAAKAEAKPKRRSRRRRSGASRRRRAKKAPAQASEDKPAE